MGYILDNCPQVQACCCCIPLRQGAALVGAAGLVCAALFLYGFSEPAADWALGKGFDKTLVKLVRYFNGATGVLLAAGHALLLFAVVYESDSLCEVYMWLMASWWAALALGAAAASLSLLAAGADLVYPSALLSATVAGTLLSFYFVLVVANYRMTLP